MPDEKKQDFRPLPVVLVIILIGTLSWFYLGSAYEFQQKEELARIEGQVKNDMARIEQQVAQDSVKQYNIAKRSGSSMDAYVHAGFVAAAYLQAKDEANYRKWKKIEKQDGRLAGIPE